MSNHRFGIVSVRRSRQPEYVTPRCKPDHHSPTLCGHTVRDSPWTTAGSGVDAHIPRWCRPVRQGGTATEWRPGALQPHRLPPDAGDAEEAASTCPSGPQAPSNGPTLRASARRSFPPQGCGQAQPEHRAHVLWPAAPQTAMASGGSLEGSPSGARDHLPAISTNSRRHEAR